MVMRKLHKFIPTSGLSLSCVRGLRSCLLGSVRMRIVSISRTGGHLILSTHRLLGRGRGTTHSTRVTDVGIKAILGKAMRALRGCKTFMGLRGKLSNLIRISRVSRGHMGVPSSILAINSRIRIGIVNVGSNGVDLDVGTLRRSGRGTRRGTRGIIVPGTRSVKAGLKSLFGGVRL